MPRILSISFSEFNSDARVLRQLAILREFGDVTTVGFGEAPPGVHDHVSVDSSLPSLPQTPIGVLKLAFRRFSAVELSAPAVKVALERLHGREFDLVVANEARALPLAHAVAGGAPIWGDMHEWAPEERTHVLSWRLLVAPYMKFVCEKYLPLTQAVTTVNGSIAALYDSNFGCTTDVVRNSIAFQDLEPSAVDSGAIRLVHSGGAVPGRNLEGLVEALLRLDERFTLDFFLVPARDGGRYLRQLKLLADSSDRIRFHDAVKPHELPATLNAFDVGVYSIPPQTTNHRFMLPNKFFDFVQARLALVFGPTVETTTLIEQYGLGVIARDYSVDAMVEALSALSRDDVARFKANASAAARELSSQQDVEVQRRLIGGLLEAK